MKIIVCLGPSCSGKTTWSLEKIKNDPTFIRFSIDEFRLMTVGSLNFSKLDDKFMQIMYNFITNLTMQGRNLVIDNIPLSAQWLSMLSASCQDVELRLFDVSIKEALIRNKKKKQEGNPTISPVELMRYHRLYTEFLKSDAFYNHKRKESFTIICDDFIDINKQFIASNEYEIYEN
jgi:predicted kinase